MKLKKKLCYAINEYNINTDTHYKACYELIDSISNEFDIFLILEKKSSKVNLNVNKVYTSKCENLLLKSIELFLITVYARILGYNLFYSHYTIFSRLIFALISRLTFAKSYHWHCGIMKLFWKDKIENFTDFKNKLFIEYPERLSWKLNHYLVTGNMSMKKHYNNDFSVSLKKILVLPNFIDITKFDPQNYNKKEISNIYKNKKIILFVHRIVERKGAHFLVPIMKKVISVKTNVILLVLGDGPYLEKLKQDIISNKLENNFRLVGKIPNDLVPQYFSISDIFLMPSLEEGFPHVLLESMAMEVPYVASDIGGVKEISPNNLKKYVIPIDNLNEFSERIIKLLNFNKVFNLRNYVEKKYSLQKIQIKFKKLFSS